MTRDARPPVNARAATVAGLCASLVGIGLARFAYTPLIPALIAAGWFAPGEAAYLGAANLVGYLAGALAGRRLTAWLPADRALRGLMLLATASFFACAAPVSFAWFFLWRFASGLAGGGLMVLAAPTVLPHVPPARRGLAGGIIFTGVGIGIAASGTLVPLLQGWGLTATWGALGAVALLLTAAAWRLWPAHRAAPQAAPVATDAPAAPTRSPATLKALYFEYALNAAGLVPHMVFLVDFIARGLGHGLATGAFYWVLFGLGATAGPVLAGSVADRIGFKATLRLAFVVQTLAIALLLVADRAAALAASSFIIGAFVPGVVPLVLGRTQELLPAEGEARKIAWTWCTTAFAVGQAVGAYALSFLFAQSASYLLLFAVGAILLALALASDLIVAAWCRPSCPLSRRAGEG